MGRVISSSNVVDHDFIGQYYHGHDGKIYFCKSWEEGQGFWMYAIDGLRRTNVSDRAIGRTFHKLDKSQLKLLIRTCCNSAEFSLV